MSYDSLDILRRFHEERELPYPLLRDVAAKHVLAFGVLNREYEPGSRAYGIPHPGIFMLGTNGVIKAKFAVPGYRDRPPLANLHAELADMMARPAQPPEIQPSNPEQ